MKTSVVIQLEHVHLFAHNKLNLRLPCCLLVATDSARWVTTFHLSKLSPRFYNIRVFCVWASGLGPAPSLPRLSFKSHQAREHWPGNLLWQWRSGDIFHKTVWLTMGQKSVFSHHGKSYIHSHTHGHTARVPCVTLKMLHMARLSHSISPTQPGVTTLWWCPYLSLGF